MSSLALPGCMRYGKATRSFITARLTRRLACGKRCVAIGKVMKAPVLMERRISRLNSPASCSHRLNAKHSYSTSTSGKRAGTLGATGRLLDGAREQHLTGAALAVSQQLEVSITGREEESFV